MWTFFQWEREGEWSSERNIVCKDREVGKAAVVWVARRYPAWLELRSQRGTV